MIKVSNSNPKDAALNQQQATKLLKDALKQPGVRELSEVYQASLRYTAAAALYQQALTPKMSVTLSDVTSAAI
ncbi:MAG: hypothetical protein IH984_06405 [Planctomycetes bacterium]|nr:hypothetical protein [Planctomycetota bacterium]